MVQWLRLCASTTGGMGLILGQGTKILHAIWHRQNKTKQKKTTPPPKPNKQPRTLVTELEQKFKNLYGNTKDQELPKQS